MSEQNPYTIVTMILLVVGTIFATAFFMQRETQAHYYNLTYAMHPTQTNYIGFMPSQQCKDRETTREAKIIGSSMLPTLKQNDVILEVEYDPEIPVVVGDIVVIEGVGAHRVWGTYEDYLVTKGDNNPVKDRKSNYNEIQHVVCGVKYA